MRLAKSLSVSMAALAVTATSLSMMHAPALAADPAPMPYDTWYVSVFGGLNLAETHASFSTDHYQIRMKDGFTVGAAVGSYVADGVRLERELSYSKNSSKDARYEEGVFGNQDGYTSGLFLMTNLWKDFRTSSRFQPYIGGGIGAALLSGSGDDETVAYDFDGSLAFAAQLGAGARYALSDRLALDAGYRFRAAMDATHLAALGAILPNGAFSYYNHSLTAGLTYAFGANGAVMPAPEGDSGLYLSLFAGAAFPDTMSWEYEGTIYALNQKTGFTVGAAVGTQLAPGLRGEAEISHVRTKLKSVEFDSSSVDPASGDVGQTFFLANLWKDFNFGPVSPYVGGGIGFGLVNFDNGVADGDVLSDDTGVGIAGQFGFGARMAVSDRFVIDAGYRYKSIVDAMIIGGGDRTYNYDVATHNHVLQIGATYDAGGMGMAEAPDMTNKYVSVFGGLSQINDTHFNYSGSNYVADFKSGFTVGAAVGGNINDKLRGEVELSMATGKVDAIYNYGILRSTVGEVNGYYLMTNLWRDVDMGAFTPYFGGGVGLALMDVNIDLRGIDPNIDETFALAAQVGAGLRYNVTDNVTLDAGYRMKAALAAFTSGTNGAYHTMGTYYTHVGQIGLAWHF